MSTRWEDLIRGIRQDPDADAPRLVCADWLIDRGDARGDYIALACRHSVTRGGTSELWQLWDELSRFKPLEHLWLVRLVKLGADSAHQRRPVRGFIDSVRIDSSALRNFPAMCRLEPIVELTLGDSGHRGYSALADAPELAELRRLVIQDDEPRGCEALLASPSLVNLHDLHLRPTRAVVAAIASGTVRPTRPRFTRIEPRDLVALVAAGFYDAIEELDVASATDELVCELARSPLAHLRRIRFHGAQLSARAFEALGARLDQLEQLSLDWTAIDAATAAVLVEHMPSGNLRSLHYEARARGDELDRFICSPAFRGVEEFRLRRYTPALERSGYRGKLRTLVVTEPGSLRFADLPGVEIRSAHDAW